MTCTSARHFSFLGVGKSGQTFGAAALSINIILSTNNTQLQQLQLQHPTLLVCWMSLTTTLRSIKDNNSKKIILHIQGRIHKETIPTRNHQIHLLHLTFFSRGLQRVLAVRPALSFDSRASPSRPSLIIPSCLDAHDNPSIL